MILCEYLCHTNPMLNEMWDQLLTNTQYKYYERVTASRVRTRVDAPAFSVIETMNDMLEDHYYLNINKLFGK